MKKIAQGIVRLRKLILTVAVLLLIPSAIGAIATRINYDILTYLPQDLDSMIGEVALEDDFHLASTGMITVEGLPTNELIAMKKEIEAVPGVTQTFWLSDVIDPNIPTAMLPADVQQFMFGKNDSTMLIVRFDAPSASDETMEAVQQIEKLLRKDCFFGGMSVILQDTKALVNQEMPLYILIAVGASLLVLFLSLESTITPLLFMLGLLFPIAYNFGTNIFLGQISYITEALATVLQLGVTMDFSIFLLHRYQEEKELRSSNEEAMTSAICKTMTSISASSLTTIAGFLALCAMRLTLGRDIGLVMAKGVALGVICTVVILPSLILTFDKWVEKYKHRTVIPRLTKLSYFVSKHSVPIVAVFILILIPFAIAQNKTSVYYTLFDSLPQDLTGYDEHRRRFALLISGGVAAIIAAVGICNLFDSSNSILGVTRLNDFLTFLCICIGVIAGLAMLVPGGMSHAEFKRRHPYIEDFYTEEDHSRETRLLVIGIVGGIAAILIGIALTVYADDVLGISDGWPNAIMLMLCSVAVFGFVYCGIRHGMLDIDGYNKEADTDGKKERAAGHDFYDNLTGTVCGIIMSLATITALCLLFLGPWMLHDDWSFVGSGPFWLPWPIGGVLCGIASLIIQLVKNYRRRNDDGQGAGQPGRTK